MRHGSLFSGIGGFDLAAQWMGWENIFHCEWNPFGQRVLKHYWPNAKSYEDITQTDFTIHRGSIDILTGGFPCQPYSMAGKRKGKEDERHLWPEMLRAIREIAPRYIVGENVLGLVNWDGGLVFDEVQADLESAGYEVAAVVIPAAAVNAPHGRDRVWFIAKNTNSIGLDDGKANTRRGGNREFKSTSSIRKVDETHRDAADSEQQGRKEWRQIDGWENSTQNKTRLHDRIERLGNDGDAADTSHKRPIQCGISREVSKKERISGKQGSEFGISSKAVCNGFKPDWQNFPTESPICGGDDGLPTELDGITFSKWRNESIKAYGNAIVPQVAFEIFKSIERADAL